MQQIQQDTQIFKKHQQKHTKQLKIKKNTKYKNTKKY